MNQSSSRIDERLNLIEEFRKQKSHTDAYRIGLDLYENYRHDMTPLQINKLYSELIANKQEMINMYQIEFVNILKNTQQLEQLIHGGSLECHNIEVSSELKDFIESKHYQSRIEELNVANNVTNDVMNNVINDVMNDVSFEYMCTRDNLYGLIGVEKYRNHGNHKDAMILAIYIYATHFNKLMNEDKLKLFDELIVNGCYADRESGYKCGIDFYNWFNRVRDENIHNILCKDKRYINNFKFFDDYEHVYDKFMLLLKQMNLEIYNIIDLDDDEKLDNIHDEIKHNEIGHDGDNLEKTNAYVINLDDRTDRWEQLNDQFKNIKTINLVRFPALKGTPGWHYCGYSQRQIINDHCSEDSNILVFEDDCLIKNPESFDKRWPRIKKWLDENGDRWDIFSGGTAHLSGKINIIDKELGIAEVMTGYSAHFMYYNKRYFNQLLKWKPHKELKWDLFRVADPNVRIFISGPFLATQTISYSNIEETMINRDDYFASAENILLSEFTGKAQAHSYNLVMCNITDSFREGDMNDSTYGLTKKLFDEDYDYLSPGQKLTVMDYMMITGYMINESETYEYVQRWMEKLNGDEELKKLVRSSRKVLNNLRVFGVFTI
jgi:hypothetical protein